MPNSSPAESFRATTIQSPTRCGAPDAAEDASFAARFYRAVAVFLADRLRNTVARLGYGAGQDLDENAEYAGELDFGVLDNVHLAGARFDRMLKRLVGAM